MKLLIVGLGRAGKDTAGEYLESISTLKFAGTTSRYLAPYVADRLGVTVDDAYRDRHRNRDEWYRIGNEIRENDPGILIRESLRYGDIVGGVRDWEEIVAARRGGMVDLIVWIENIWVPVDPTVKFSARECDLTIPNNWGIDEFRGRLRRFAAAIGILR